MAGAPLLHSKHKESVKDTPEVQMGQSRTVREIIRDHIDAEGPATPKQVAEGTGENYNTVRSTMNRMKGNELDLLNAEKGVYDLSERIQPSDTSARNRDAPRDPIYPAVASAGDGSYDISEDPIGYIQGENALSRPGRDVFWMPVRGDSMDDTLPKGGLVPVQRFDPTLFYSTLCNNYCRGGQVLIVPIDIINSIVLKQSMDINCRQAYPPLPS
jgi:hypothetical protein